jgi:hypothetical protein
MAAGKSLKWLARGRRRVRGEWFLIALFVVPAVVTQVRSLFHTHQAERFGLLHFSICRLHFDIFKVIL